jgi:choline dehydrogenase-like flavoprotein
MAIVGAGVAGALTLSPRRGRRVTVVEAGPQVAAALL